MYILFTTKTYQMETQNKEENKTTKKYTLIIFFLSLLSVTLGILLWMEKQNIKKEIVEKTVYIEKTTSLESDLSQLKEAFEDLETEDDSIRNQLNERIKQIEVLQAEAVKHKDDKYIIAKLRKETETLRAIMKGFVVTIDSLNTANQTLVAEKEKISYDLKSEKKKASKLEQDKEDLQGVINLAGVLKASAFKISGVRFKSGGKKETETNKAKKTEKLRVAFTLAENKITKAGDKEIYLRVISPDGRELFEREDEQGKFKFGETKGYYAAKQSIGYGNQEYVMTMYCSSPDGFPTGAYNIEVYEGGIQIGKTFHVLE